MKKVKIALAAILFCAFINAQDRNEFSVYFGGGLGTLKYKSWVGEYDYGYGSFGFLGGFGYSLFFTNNFGIGTGVEFAQYNAKYIINNIHISYDTYDIDGDLFNFRSVVSNYTERQSATMLQIPLMLQFQFGNTEKLMYYFALGGKGGVSLKSYAKTGNPRLKNSGYYKEEDFLHTTQNFVGFGDFAGIAQKDNLDLRTAIFASVETGAKIRLKNQRALYLAAYFDYDFKNLSKKESGEFIKYDANNPQKYPIKSIMNSSMGNKLLVDKITLFAVGFKLKLAFGKGNISDKSEKETIEPKSVPEEDAAESN